MWQTSMHFWPTISLLPVALLIILQSFSWQQDISCASAQKSIILCGNIHSHFYRAISLTLLWKTITVFLTNIHSCGAFNYIYETLNQSLQRQHFNNLMQRSIALSVGKNHSLLPIKSLIAKALFW
ncbi:hypothetical protein O6H91_07G069800 [Diphasiastrum complanatum]|uniref:Uncharacterized protein n=1 Tax=Diphasiastrum complanatum TaxID=34168 RepID=A0ACC2D6B4_DIPCM|nr:hypothetical protein O6H91_07G069800 [Diphasiastrum complanatum]